MNQGMILFTKPEELIRIQQFGQYRKVYSSIQQVIDQGGDLDGR